MSKPHIYLGESLGHYGFPNGHPFGPWRMDAFWQALRDKGLEQQVAIEAPVIASEEAIERFHDRAYLEQVKARSEDGLGYLDFGDTPAYIGVYDDAATVVGSCLDAVERIMKNEFQRAFLPIAGLHHARREGASGFCVFNDCGVVIETLLDIYGLERIAYVDIDAHHGDGVFYAFETNPHVLIADLHEDGHYLFPGTGEASETGRNDAEGTKLNIPPPPNADETVFLERWDEVETFINQHEPQFFLLQCGVDSLAGDPLTDLKLTPNCHRYAAQRLVRLADKFAKGRLLAVGGGGYAKANIEQGWTAVVDGLLGLPGD